METINGKRESLEEKAVEIISERIKPLSEQENIILGVCGGTSVAGIFQKLGNKNLDWKKVHIFLVDERIVPRDSKESNFHIASESLPKYATIHPFNLSENAEEDLKSYESKFKQLGGNFDIILLSSGEDGHIASLFPNKELNGEYFIKINDSPKPPKERVSVSVELLQKSKTSILVFFTKNKTDAYKKFLDENLTIEDCPAKLVKNIGESYVLVDEEIN